MPREKSQKIDDTEASRIIEVGLSEGDDEIESGLDEEFIEKGAPF